MAEPEHCVCVQTEARLCTSCGKRVAERDHTAQIEALLGTYRDLARIMAKYRTPYTNVIHDLERIIKR